MSTSLDNYLKFSPKRLISFASRDYYNKYEKGGCEKQPGGNNVSSINTLDTGGYSDNCARFKYIYLLSAVYDYLVERRSLGGTLNVLSTDINKQNK